MITIPPLPPSELHGCNIIDLQYNVIVSTVIDCILCNSEGGRGGIVIIVYNIQSITVLTITLYCISIILQPCNSEGGRGGIVIIVCCNIIDLQYNVIVSTVIDCILYTMITIPPLPPSELHGCNIIDIQYNVIVSTVIDCETTVLRYLQLHCTVYQ
jgi:hypothetical protein